MDEKETNFLTPILSAIAGLATIATVLSPIFISNEALIDLMVDPRSVKFLSVIGFLVTILVLWFFASRNAYFLDQDDIHPARLKLRMLAILAIVGVAFYASKLLFEANVFNAQWASFAQACFYISGFGLLAALIGMLFRDTYDQYTWNSRNKRRRQILREAILDSGFVKIDLKITRISSHKFTQGESIDWMNTYDVTFITGDNKYDSVVSDDLKSVLYCKKIS